VTPIDDGAQVLTQDLDLEAGVEARHLECEQTQQGALLTQQFLGSVLKDMITS